MIALGYVQPDGTPDVPRWSLEKRYDKTVVYYWVNDQRTPMKDLKRLAKDLDVPPEWLLLGAKPAAKKRGRPRKVIAGLILGALALAGVPVQAEPLPRGDWGPGFVIMSTTARRRRLPFFGGVDAVPSAA